MAVCEMLGSHSTVVYSGSVDGSAFIFSVKTIELLDLRWRHRSPLKCTHTPTNTQMWVFKRLFPVCVCACVCARVHS